MQYSWNNKNLLIGKTVRIHVFLQYMFGVWIYFCSQNVTKPPNIPKTTSPLLFCESIKLRKGFLPSIGNVSAGHLQKYSICEWQMLQEMSSDLTLLHFRSDTADVMTEFSLWSLWEQNQISPLAGPAGPNMNDYHRFSGGRSAAGVMPAFVRTLWSSPERAIDSTISQPPTNSPST